MSEDFDRVGVRSRETVVPVSDADTVLALVADGVRIPEIVCDTVSDKVHVTSFVVDLVELKDFV